jgi:surfactin synthase thioesterase subunit
MVPNELAMTDRPSNDTRAIRAWRHRAIAGRRGRPLLACFPHAGGSAAFFAPWVAAFGHFAHTVPVQYPGHGHRCGEKPFGAMDPLVRALHEEISPVLESRFSFFGHSLGALVAFETSRRCEATGRAGPSHLFVSASPPPHRRPPRRIGDLPDDEFIAALGKYGQHTVTSLGDPDLRRYALPLLRADIRLVETYVPSSPTRVSCDVTVLGGRQDAAVPAEALRGWEEWTAGTVRYVELDGDHFFLRRQSAGVAGIVAQRVTG